MTQSNQFSYLLFAVAASALLFAEGFSPASHSPKFQARVSSIRPNALANTNIQSFSRLCMAAEDESSSSSSSTGVVELADDEDDTNTSPASTAAAPFLSQGEISEDALNPDLSDPKQTRVILYIIISLVPVLFLVPFMLGSRDLIPLDELPPVSL